MVAFGHPVDDAQSGDHMKNNPKIIIVGKKKKKVGWSGWRIPCIHLVLCLMVLGEG